MRARRTGRELWTRCGRQEGGLEMDQDAERNAPVGEMDEYMDRENETVRDMNGETEGGKRKCVSVTEWPRLGEMETDRGGDCWDEM